MQADVSLVDGRTDMYALGVILFIGRGTSFQGSIEQIYNENIMVRPVPRCVTC